MKATDFRIGNRVIVNHRHDIEGTITWVQEESISVTFDERQEDLTNGLILPPEKVIGIEITKDVLLKYGFKHEEKWQDCWLWKHGFGMCLHNNKYHFNDMTRSKRLDYLHQLQNMYYAIMGEELQPTGGEGIKT